MSKGNAVVTGLIAVAVIAIIVIIIATGGKKEVAPTEMPVEAPVAEMPVDGAAPVTPAAETPATPATN